VYTSWTTYNRALSVLSHSSDKAILDVMRLKKHRCERI